MGGTKLDLSSSYERDDYWSSTEKSKTEAYTLSKYGLSYENKTDTSFQNTQFSYDGSVTRYNFIFVVRPVMKI